MAFRELLSNIFDALYGRSPGGISSPFPSKVHSQEAEQITGRKVGVSLPGHFDRNLSLCLEQRNLRIRAPYCNIGPVSGPLSVENRGEIKLLFPVQDNGDVDLLEDLYPCCRAWKCLAREPLQV